MTDHPTNAPHPIRLTDAGLETVLIFEEGIDLPAFAAFPLVRDPDGRAALDRYYRRFVELADRERAEIVLDTPTWRASATWGAELGYDVDSLETVNAAAVAMLREIRASIDTDASVLVSGCVGSHADGYRADDRLGVDEARGYHRRQIRTLAEHGVDHVTALTMTNVSEATGLALAARDVGIPVVVSFTVETDGRLPSGESLADAVTAVDAATDHWPLHFGINCAHPDHFVDVLDPDAAWTGRELGPPVPSHPRPARPRPRTRRPCPTPPPRSPPGPPPWSSWPPWPVPGR